MKLNFLGEIMLDLMRKKKEHWISASIILLVAGVMAFFGFSNFSDNNSPNQPVAWVNGQVISQKDFSRELEFTINQYRSVLGAKFDEKLLEAFQIPQRTLERMVQFKLLCQQAEKMGFFVSDEELADYIKSLPYFQKDGKFDSAFYSQLPNRGVEEKKQREQMNASRLQKYMTSRIKSLPSQSVLEGSLQGTQVSLEYAPIDFNELAKKIKPTSEDLKKALEDEAGLKNAYETQKEKFTSPAQYRFRQIRSGVPFEASQEKKANSRQKIMDIAKKVTPETFEAQAKVQSDDEYAKTGGERPWMNEKDLPAPFVAALASLKPGGISSAFEAPGGMFLVQLIEKKDSTVKPFIDVKAQLAREVAEQKKRSSYIEGLKKSLETKLAAGQSIDKDLKLAGIKLKRTPSFSLDQNSIPDIGSSESIMDALYDLTPQSRAAKRLYFYQDKYYYLKLANFSQKKALQKTTPESQTGFASTIQKFIFEEWLRGIEKGASIKLKSPFAKEKTA